jgi:thioesterase domain-containing protein
MLHTRLSEVVDHYTTQILSVQPRGPFLLGGLCIGGFIAFEIARKLKNQGHQIGMVALIDAAHVKAPAVGVNSKRMNRFLDVIAADVPLRQRLHNIMGQGFRKIGNFIGYTVRSRRAKARNWLRMKLFRSYLDNRRSIPKALRNIPVQVVLRFAEREYVVPPSYDGEVLLLRATQKDRVFDGTLIDDTPYVELFTEPLLGWTGRARELKVHDLPGGHSSMLQEPNVRALADLMKAHLESEIQSRPL